MSAGIVQTAVGAYCTYCGHEYGRATASLAGRAWAHARECGSHPCAEELRRVAKLEEALAESDRQRGALAQRLEAAHADARRGWASAEDALMVLSEHLEHLTSDGQLVLDHLREAVMTRRAAIEEERGGGRDDD